MASRMPLRMRPRAARRSHEMPGRDVTTVGGQASGVSGESGATDARVVRRSPVVPRVLRVLAACAFVRVAAPASAQLPSLRRSAQPTDTSAVAVSPESPRAAIQDFLRLAAGNDWASAAGSLSLSASNRGRGEELARRLMIVLDQRLAISLRALSPLAVGDTTDGDPTGDRIGVVPSAGERDDGVRLIRVTAASPPRWVFAPETVGRIDVWYANLGPPWLRDRLPPGLMREGPWHVFYWQWIGLAIALPLLVLLSWLISTVCRSVLRRLSARTETAWDDVLVASMRGPFQLCIAAVATSPLLEVLALNARLAAAIASLTRVLVLVAVLWALLRLIRLVQEHVANAVWHGGDSQQVRTLVPLLGNILRATLAIVALLVILSQLGYPVGTLLAGLGIGGISVALAGQKTVEHLFGSVSLAADKAFRVGDWVRVGATEGAVERIGLRSTSLRTNERTVVRIPNGRLADERIETFGERDRMLLRTEIELTHGTSAAQIDRIRDDIDALLRAEPVIWPDVVRVAVVALSESAIRLRVMAWFQTSDYESFLHTRHRLLLGFLSIVERHGSSVAFPSRTIYHVNGVSSATTAASVSSANVPL